MEYPITNQNSNDVPQLNRFLGSQVYRIIMEMPSRTCELDIIPTDFLKKVLVHCIPPITKVDNLSLSMGHFYEDWKLAIVRLHKVNTKGN